MTGTTIGAGYPGALLEFAVSRGASRRALLERSGLGASELSGPDSRIPVEKYIALFEAAIDLTGDPALALHFGEAVRIQEFSIVGLICEACETTLEVGQQLNRYAALIADEGRAEPAALIRAVPQGGRMWLECPSGLFARYPLMAESEFARLVWNARVMFRDSAEFRRLKFPHEMHFMHEDRFYGGEYERVFGAPVRFGKERNAMLVDAGFLSLRQPPVNRYVFGVLSAHAEALLREIEASRTTRGRVESLLMRVLHKGEANMDSIAAGMGMSRQTLLRRLKAEGITFKEVVEELRRALALHYLSGRKVSVNETAYLTGFSDPAAFSRAFKRWTGRSPRAFQRSS